MAKKPLNKDVGLVTMEIMVEGSEIPGHITPTSLEITHDINRISHAKIIIPDGEMPTQTFPVSEGDLFVPGKELQINLGYSNRNQEVFKGIVTGQTVKVGATGRTELIIKCYGKAIKMTVGRHSKYFLEVKDSDLMKTLISDAGLSADVGATTFKHKELIQYDVSDWDFLMVRAEANGMIVYDQFDKILVKKPEVSGSSVLTLAYGVDLYKVDLEMDARQQLPKNIVAGSWDQSKQEWQESKAKSPSEPSWGNIKGDNLSDVAGASEFSLTTIPPVDKKLLEAWASARLLKSRLGKIQGSVSCRGAVGVEPNKLIKLEGMGERFNGDLWVSGVTHKVKSGEWTMDLKIGLSPNWFSENTPDLMMPPAGGLMAGIQGLQIGVVKKIHEDPEGDHRIQITLPAITSGQDGVWARMGHLYASKEIGSFFLPEVGDEVVVGFLNDDPTYPVILGMMYSRKHAPPWTADDKNTHKGIVTKSKMKLTFNDDEKWVTLETPGANILTITDKDEKIELEDQHGNKFTMDSSGITLDTPKDFTVKAKGKISMEATGEVSIKSSGGDVKAEGLNVNLKASVKFAAEGSAAAELKASGQTTVKGAMVMIN